MHVGVKQSMTGATALLAAGAIAIGPAIGPVSAQAPEALRAAHVADINLMATPDPIAALEGFTESGLRLVQGIAELPVAAIAAALAIADGDPQAFYNSIRQVIDAPLWVIDPALGINQTSLTGKGLAALFPDHADDIQAFRNNVLWAATDSFRSSIADLLGVEDTSTPLDVLTPLAGFAAGALDSGYRLVEGLALAPFGPLKAIIDIAGGMEPNVAVYRMLDSYISAPLWVADSFMGTGPTQQAIPIGLKALLPNRADGIQDFRNDVLWKATNSVREVVREALGVDPSENPNNPQNTLVTSNVSKLPAPKTLVSLDVETAPPAPEKVPAETVEVKKPAVEKTTPLVKARSQLRESLNFSTRQTGTKVSEGSAPSAPTKPDTTDLTTSVNQLKEKFGFKGGGDSPTPGKATTKTTTGNTTGSATTDDGAGKKSASKSDAA
ncbi:hypothetical protein A5719_26395 [Mycolicibacterium peregrinum]|uniref:Uncharacterized protein n=2 Tax=Mycolicibacterium peregrinum TaxID=43304 RepID=A0A1A1YSY1_MYCPR|nr:hypothetical protein A5779_22090 [Mycolicibacterium peregrinum]OBF34423.1 hypothetical protein A5719_26395 [Mycolicibacterium peregrinum]